MATEKEEQYYKEVEKYFEEFDIWFKEVERLYEKQTGNSLNPDDQSIWYGYFNQYSTSQEMAEILINLNT